QSKAHQNYQRDLGNGLVLRWSTKNDLEGMVSLYAEVFRPSAEAPPGWIVPLWTRDMFSGHHPHIGPCDFALVEHARSGALVAATCLLSYRCEYEGIPFRFGRPELVATLPEHRRQGLIRAIFELIHARSDERGDLAQGITGIPYYYRQFGYEYAATLDEGETTVYFPEIAALKSGTTEPYVLREARLDDIPLLCRLWTQAHAQIGVRTVIDEEHWRWTMAGTHPDALQRWRVYMIAEASGQTVGALMLMPGRWGATIAVNGPLVDTGVPLVRVIPSLLRGLQALAETTRPIRPETPAAAGVRFQWSPPALQAALGDTRYVKASHPYAWYLRVRDLPRFLRHISPVLERRLRESAHAGYTGELTVNFYRGGLRLTFDGGKLLGVDDWQVPLWGEGMAGFPPLVFLQALFGHRSLDELRHFYPHLWAAGDVEGPRTATFSQARV